MSDDARGAPSALEYISDHADRAFARLPGRDREDKPRLEAFVRALGSGVQVVEDQIVDLIDGRRLETANGITLDRWGAIVGEARGTLNDEDYRRFISARILANACRGDVEGILAVWRLITAPSSFVRFRPLYPAAYELIVVRSSWLTDDLRRRIRRMMDALAPGTATGVYVEALDGYVGDADDPYATGFDAGPLARIL